MSISVHSWLASLRQGENRIALHEQIGSRKRARTAQLSRRTPHCLAGVPLGHRLVNPARAGTDNLALRAGPTSRDGLESDRGLVAETSPAALYQCDPGDARAVRYDRHYHPLCDSTSDRDKVRN